MAWLLWARFILQALLAAIVALLVWQQLSAERER
jgi:hypothetical protein